MTLTQPNAATLHAGFDARKLDAAGLESVRTELFGRYLQTCELDCNAGDQLAMELNDFVHCLRTGARPRVDGVDGRDAVALATQIVDRLRRHFWDGGASGPCGPNALPEPLGPLFTVAETKAA